MKWLQVTYYAGGVIGAVRCTAKHLEDTKRGIISGHGEVLDVKEVVLNEVPVM